MRGFIIWTLSVCLWNVKCSIAETTDSVFFDCDADGYIANITASSVQKEQIVLDDHGSYCYIANSTCQYENQKKLRVFFAKGEKSSDIIAGRDVQIFDLECNSNFDAKVTAKVLDIQQNVSVTKPILIQHENKPRASINLEIKSKSNQLTDVHIGDKLSMELTGPVNYTIDLKACTAYRSESDKVGHELWNGSSCTSTDKAIMDDNWIVTDNKISIEFYAFKFVDSQTVIIECSAHFCWNRSCTAACPKQSGRKRRNAYIESRPSPVPNSIDGSARASYTIGYFNINSNNSPELAMNVFIYILAVVTSRAMLLRFA